MLKMASKIKTLVNGRGDCKGHLTDYGLTVTQMMGQDGKEYPRATKPDC